MLVLARNYPNSVFPTLGLWTRRLVSAGSGIAEPTVIAPVPFAPPLLPIESYAQFRRVPRRRREPDANGGYEVFHPRIPLPPGNALQRFEVALSWPIIRRLAETLHRDRPFDLIHSHFIFPEGVIAARLGRRWGIPVVSTEGASWNPWLDQALSIRRQVLQALPGLRFILPVSETLRRNIDTVVDGKAVYRIVPNLIDEDTFRPDPTCRNTGQLLFVGLIRHVKGLDLLVRAVGQLATTHPNLRLLVIGRAFYRDYQRHEAEVRQLVHELGIGERVVFAGEQSPAQVAQAMRESAMVVVPSRRETFSVVTAEAIATGTPVVATRCGGPEEIITPESGVLVPPEDPAALAAGIREVLDRRSTYRAEEMHDTMRKRFGTSAIQNLLTSVYAEAMSPARLQ